MKSVNLQDRVKAIQIVQAKMSVLGVIRTCENCEYCDVAKSICTIWNAQPPIKVIVVGCDKWDLAIPF